MTARQVATIPAHERRTKGREMWQTLRRLRFYADRVLVSN
jgi:hypothetical protein